MLTSIPTNSRWAHSLIATAMAVFCLSVSAASEPQGRLSEAELTAFHEELIEPSEPWQGVPWRLSVLEAQQQAAAAKKPVYLLVRAGHPLGCV